MPLKPRFCSQCGGELAYRTVDEKTREVCPACETVFYRNPLPAAASLVLNEKREVLCLKRGQKLHKGKWALPIGFVEMDESVADAALRELREEAGIEGRILQMLHVDSQKLDYYGDVLIATFETEKIGGVETPGKDSEAVAYFPLDRLPELAFDSNEKAIRACKEIHKEDWAIRDSFEKLQVDEGSAMISDALVDLVRDRAEEIVRRWIVDIRSNPTTPSYKEVDPEHLLEKATAALSQFGRWLAGDEQPHEVSAFYRAVGAERQAGGFGLHEVLSSLAIFRKHIWTFALDQGVWERPIDAYRVLELDHRLMLFFDRAMYHTAKGFGAEQDH